MNLEDCPEVVANAYLALRPYDYNAPDQDDPLYQRYERLVNEYLYALKDWLMPPDNEIRERALEKVKQRQYEEYYRLQMLSQPSQLLKDIQELRNSLGEKGEIISRPYIWLCVNPNSTYTFEEFQKLVMKMVTKVWVTSYVYVYEQRGISHEELGKGFHLHAIIKKPDDKKPSHCIRELSNTFKKCCDTSNYHFFQVKFIDIDEQQRKLKYILGEKESTQENQKDLKQAMDKVWRQKINIKPFYFLDIDIGEYAVLSPQA